MHGHSITSIWLFVKPSHQYPNNGLLMVNNDHIAWWSTCSDPLWCSYIPRYTCRVELGGSAYYRLWHNHFHGNAILHQSVQQPRLAAQFKRRNCAAPILFLHKPKTSDAFLVRLLFCILDTPHASLWHENIAMDEPTSSVIICEEPDCKSSFKTEKSFRNHVNNYHQLQYTISFQGDKGTIHWTRNG